MDDASSAILPAKPRRATVVVTEPFGAHSAARIAGLYRGLRKDRLDRLRKASQAVDHGDQDVLDPRAFKSFITLSQNLAPSVVSIQRPRMSFECRAAAGAA